MDGEFWASLDKGIVAILTVLASLIIGLFSVGASILISYYTSHQTRSVAEDHRDADMLSRFAEFHFGDERHRRFSVYFAERMRNPGWRRGLREFIISDALTRHFGDALLVVPFDKNDPDWDLVGDAVYNLWRDWGHAKPEAAKTFDEWWCKKKDEYKNQRRNHTQAIDDLYKYIEEFHLKPKGAVLSPCATVKS
jgi:hypothetical protein